MKTNVWAKAARRKGFTVKEIVDSRTELLKNADKWLNEIEDLFSLPSNLEKRLSDLWENLSDLSRNTTELSDEERRALSQMVNSIAGALYNYREGNRDDAVRDLRDIGRSMAELRRMFKNNSPTTSGGGFGGSSRPRY